MKKKEYKVRFRNGFIEPLEPININGIHEGKIVFFDLSDTENPCDNHETPIWKEIQEITNKIPNNEFEKLPKDLAMNSDHYLYDSPKIEE